MLLQPNEFEAALQQIERRRRLKQYSSMQICVAALEEKVRGDSTFAGYRLRSRLQYEIHMATHDQAMSIQGADRIALLRTSLYHAELAISAAIKGNDAAGRLAAQANIAGLIMRELGQWDAGKKLSTEVGAEAAMRADHETDTRDKMRLYRVAMNTYFHRLRHEIADQGDPESISFWLGEVKKNPYYLAHKDEEWANQAAKAAEDFLVDEE